MLDRHFSAKEVAKHARMPLATLGWLVKEGVLRPSVRQASGRGRTNLYDFQDVLSAMALTALRLPNARAKPLKLLVKFWRSSEGKELVRALVAEMAEREPTDDRAPRVLLVSNAGVVLDGDVASVMRERNVSSVFCLDARAHVENLFRWSTETEVMQPGLSGRMPRQKKPGAKKKADRPRKSRGRLRALLVEAYRQHAAVAVGKK
jgi:hypothetical protein